MRMYYFLQHSSLETSTSDVQEILQVKRGHTTDGTIINFNVM